MNQPSFSDIEYGFRKRTTKREGFLKTMDDFIPWDEWVAYVEPFYPNGRHGRPPLGIEKMLRMYLLQCGFALSDESIEDAIYDSDALRSFMGIDFIHEQVPDATTWLKFRHLLEAHNLCKVFFQADDVVVYGDSGYIGMEKREEVKSSDSLSAKAYRINRRHKSVQRMPAGHIEREKEIERRKSPVRSKVEHPFLIVKRYFGFAKTVYRRAIALCRITHASELDALQKPFSSSAVSPSISSNTTNSPLLASKTNLSRPLTAMPFLYFSSTPSPLASFPS
jgi:IS5 family transposase